MFYVLQKKDPATNLENPDNRPTNERTYMGIGPSEGLGVNGAMRFPGAGKAATFRRTQAATPSDWDIMWFEDDYTDPA